QGVSRPFLRRHCPLTPATTWSLDPSLKGRRYLHSYTELQEVARRSPYRFERASPCARHGRDSHGLALRSPADETERASNHLPSSPASSIAGTNRRTDWPLRAAA